VLTTPVPNEFPQSASFAQVFWAARGWLVASAIAERLHVEAPFEERLTAGKFELAARLATQATLGISTRIQRDAITAATRDRSRCRRRSRRCSNGIVHRT
jgi:hypothetical protein